MYHVESGVNPALRNATLDAPARARTGAVVYFIGLTSLLTDISAEMVASILPIYLFTVLRLSPFEYGIIDGLYHGASATVRLVSAYLADRSRQHKAVAFTGYLLSAISKVLLLFAGFAGWLSVAGVIVVDRIGKGIRTSPRDALIASHATPQTLGTAFGVHRALDAIGAMLGPLLATGILLWLPRRFDYVFLVSLCFAIFGLLIFGLLVRPGAKQGDAAAPAPVTIAATLRAIKTPRFALLTAAATVLALFTLTDNMIYLGLQQRVGFEATYLPLLFVGTAAVFMCLAIPLGRLADRFGHVRIFFIGHLLLGIVYCLYAALPTAGMASVVMSVLLLGAYYAATDGVVAALAIRLLPPEIHATGVAFITTLMGLGRMGSSFLFGWAWDSLEQEQAVGMFGIALLVTLILVTALAARYGKRLPSSPQANQRTIKPD